MRRSYLAKEWPCCQNSLDSGAGVIDAKYRGEIKVLLFNHSDENFTVEPGDRIAQLLVQKVENISFLPVESLDETERNLGGFGSTGK